MKLMLEVVTMLMSGFAALFLANGTYNHAIYTPLSLIASFSCYLACVWVIFYIAAKEKFRFVPMLIIITTQVSFWLIIASGYVERKSNEHVYITEKLDYKDGIDKNDLFIFNYNSKQLKDAIERYNN
jgi:hypothetical protein